MHLLYQHVAFSPQVLPFQPHCVPSSAILAFGGMTGTIGTIGTIGMMLEFRCTQVCVSLLITYSVWQMHSLLQLHSELGPNVVQHCMFDEHVFFKHSTRLFDVSVG